jgi:hypothetical protein
MIYNMNITKKSQAKKPTELFRLPQDNIKKYRPPKSDKKSFEAAVKKFDALEKEGKFKTL